MQVDLTDSMQVRPALAKVWARRKISEIVDAGIMGSIQDPGPKILQIALDYSLLSAQTAFIAVDSSRQTAGSHGVVVPVAVPVPDGVRYETTVH
jgi:Ca-activated chloride channel family protein